MSKSVRSVAWTDHPNYFSGARRAALLCSGLVSCGLLVRNSKLVRERSASLIERRISITTSTRAKPQRKHSAINYPRQARAPRARPEKHTRHRHRPGHVSDQKPRPLKSHASSPACRSAMAVMDDAESPSTVITDINGPGGWGGR